MAFALASAASGALADATAPAGLTLPTPIEAKVSVPRIAALLPLSDEKRTIQLSDSLRLQFEQDGLTNSLPLSPLRTDLGGSAELQDLLQIRATAAGLDWDLDSWGGLGFVIARGNGVSSLLGDFVPTALSLAQNTTTTTAGLSAHLDLGDGWITSVSYTVDTTQLDLKVGASPTLATSSVHGQSYGVAIAKHGLFGDSDSLGISFSRPSDAYFGNVSLADAGLEGRVNLLGRYRGIRLANSAQETDIAFGYVTSFFDGALALQANAGYQMNADGQNGVNGVTVVSRAKINF
ncbi:MAG: hypothetical protein JO056_09090 [Alphaproteobacteria bacterium]|nr:hypothetical protein [Alphaproteobacteria bacterium]